MWDCLQQIEIKMPLITERYRLLWALVGALETIVDVFEMDIEYLHKLLFYIFAHSGFALFGERLGEHF